MTRPAKVAMTPLRTTALAAGVLYLVTFITSIPALAFYDKVLHNPACVLGAGADGGVVWGALLEVVLGMAGIGTAVVLYPVVKRHSETAALGFVTARVLESAMIFVGVVSLLSVLTLRQHVAGTPGADAASLVTAGHALVAMHNWTLLLGPGLMPAVNAVCLGSVMYRSRLVPRIIPTIGLIGAPMLLASFTAALFGAYAQFSTPAALIAFPVAVWELSLGVWMIVKGFRTSDDSEHGHVGCTATSEQTKGSDRAPAGAVDHELVAAPT
jgi:hypothetical protein